MESLLPLLIVLTPIALFDSTSITPLCIVPLVALLGGPKPFLRSGAFLAGISLTYWVCSVLVLFGLQQVFADVSEFLGEKLRNPDTPDLWFQISLGVCMILFGSRMADSRQSHGDRGLAESVSTSQAFTGGAMLTIVGMPGAFPLFAAVDQILRADPGTVGRFLAVTYYNALFILPLVSVLVLRAWLGKAVDPLLQRINDFLAKWGHRLVMWGLLLGGAVLVLDGVGYLMGRPVLPTFD
jgi:cytochrome c biogenesis protein CcdA